MQDKTVSYAELAPGHELPSATFELSESLVSKYLRAVDGSGNGFVPPLAITACAIAAMAGSLSLPPDTIAIHASQELEFLKLVPIGATVEFRTRVAQKIARGKMSMLIMELEILERGGERTQTGKATIALPSQAE